MKEHNETIAMQVGRISDLLADFIANDEEIAQYDKPIRIMGQYTALVQTHLTQGKDKSKESLLSLVECAYDLLTASPEEKYEN